MKEKKNKKNILCFANGILGDCILFMPALQQIQRMYSRKAGYQIFLICRSSMKNMYIKYSGCDEIEYIESNLQKIRDIKFIAKFYKLVRCLNRRRYEKVIIAQPKQFNYYVAFCLRTKERYAIIYEAGFHRLYKAEQHLIIKNFDYIIFRSEEYFIGNIYRDLVRALGDENYFSSIHKIDVRKEGRQEKVMEPYVVVAPYGSVYSRRIPENILVLLIYYLLEKTAMSIYIVGTVKNEKSNFLGRFKDNKRVRDYVGLTSLDQLVDIVYNCAFVVSVDSGVTHLAAALGVKNICIVGSWGKGQFLPYDYDEKGDRDFFPRCVFPSEQIDCRNCDFIANRGKENNMCRENIKSGKSYLCLEQIDINDVYKEIDVLLGEKDGSCNA